MAEAAAPDSAPPRRQERGSWGVLVAWALPLLALGTILHTLALFLPWEHLLVCIEACAKIEAVDGPAFTVLLPSASISAAYVGILFGEASFPGLTFSVLWHTALPLTGVVLLLAYSTFGRAAMRWGILILYALWLALLSANAISFAQWLANTDQGPPTHAPQGGVASWLAYVTATGFRVYGPGLETPPSPAWGFWVLLVALGISWFAWAVALLAQWRSKASRQEARTMTSHDAAVILERPPSHLRLLSAIAITLGALLWCLGVLALVQINVDCSRPLPVTPPARATTCGAHSAFDRLQVLEQAQVAEYPQIDPGDVGAQQRYAYLGLVRDHMLLALVLVALPFALVVAWRAATRARALADGLVALSTRCLARDPPRDAAGAVSNPATPRHVDLSCEIFRGERRTCPRRHGARHRAHGPRSAGCVAPRASASTACGAKQGRRGGFGLGLHRGARWFYGVTAEHSRGVGSARCLYGRSEAPAKLQHYDATAYYGPVRTRFHR